MTALVLGSSVPRTALCSTLSMDTPSQGRPTMSKPDHHESRLHKTKSVTRSARYDGLSLRQYQARELVRFLGEQYPVETARRAAADLGEPLQTVRNWLEGTSFPNGFKLLKLQHRFGLQLFARLDPEPDASVSLALAISQRQALEAELGRVTSLLQNLTVSA